ATEDSSVSTRAAGLMGRLLLMHGCGADNVHFQGFELLVNKLISLGKTFDMRVYPGRTHGIFEGKGTAADVYTNILGYFADHLPPGPSGKRVSLKVRGWNVPVPSPSEFPSNITRYGLHFRTKGKASFL